ncbi:MAG: prephenate dehydrogenase [Bacillaceae bacterium]|nr:prephenate dehydrogenase [Bacillaceae bacterium]
MRKKVALLGVGLIGGSLALSLKPNEDVYVTAFDVNEDNLIKARRRGVIDEGTTQLAEAVVDADFIFLCAPVSKLYELISFLRYTPLKKGAVITDTGSIKKAIVEFGKGFEEKGVYMIGGHPMAGSHKSGVEAASDRLFENAYYVLTPLANTPEDKVAELKDLLSWTRARVVVMNPDEHDRVVGAISHFPHLVASALVNQVASYDTDNKWYQRLAAGGFRDITRIASSNPEMWRDITLNNRDVLLTLIEDWQRSMNEIAAYIRENNEKEIESFFRSAREYRDGLPERQKGAISPVYELYVDVPDHPGVIGKITTLLGENQISITNIKILEIREDIMGVLQISFRNQQDLDHARDLLQDNGYSVYLMD